MKGKFSHVLASLILAIAVAFTAHAAVTVNDSEDFTGFEVFIPCANGGAGETVVFEGFLHVLFTVTLDGKGGFHAKMHFQPQGLKGEGLESGDSYSATGVTQERINGKVGEVFTSVNNFRIIGQGPGNNFLVHEVIHYTVNAKGEVTAFSEHLSSDCK